MKRRNKAARKQDGAVLDCPPERLQHSPSKWINPAEIDSTEQRIGRVRRVITSRIDHLYHLGAITFLQWYAADWWRNQVENGMGNPRVCADYGQSNGSRSADPSPIPLSAKAERARALLAQAKLAMPLQVRDAIEEAIEPNPPLLVGRAASARLARWRAALDVLSAWLHGKRTVDAR